jgi:hypothetical protein
MVSIDPALGIKVIYTLGLTNVIGLLLVLSTCRCIPMIGELTAGLMKSKTYLRFYGYHCYYWLFFISSVLLHAVFAILVFGFPF